jgi:colicin import membrane protein
MTDKLKAADLIERQARTFQAIIDAAAALREIGSLEQAAAEAKQAAAEARKERDEASDDLKLAKLAIKEAKEKAKEIFNEARVSAAEVEAKAKANAEVVKSMGHEAAQSVIEQAETKAQNILAGVASDKAMLERDVLHLTEKRNAIDAEISEKEKTADALEARLAKAQAQIAKLLG